MHDSHRISAIFKYILVLVLRCKYETRIPSKKVRYDDRSSFTQIMIFNIFFCNNQIILAFFM